MNRRDLTRLIALTGAGLPNVARSQEVGSATAGGRGETRWVLSADESRIAYEVIGHGSTLVLLHLFGTNRNIWRDYGYVDALMSDFRLILIDARGHGESDGPMEQEIGVKMLDFFANPEYVELPRLNHLEAFARSDLVLPHTFEFISQT